MAAKIVFVVSEDFYFVSHRLALAAFLMKSGWDVTVVTQINDPRFCGEITGCGIKLIEARVSRGRLLSWDDLTYVATLATVLAEEQPDIVHCVAMKPVLYGSLVALGFPRIGVVNALAGLGHLFTGKRWPTRFVRNVVLNVFQWLLRRGKTVTILQNAEDIEFFHRALGLPRDRLALIPGVGVVPETYRQVVHRDRESPIVAFVARMLKDKGVYELVSAARLLRAEGVRAEFRLIGGPDDRNPNTLTQDELGALHREGVVVWLGQRNDVKRLYETADIAALPSYREGLPKSLLEAAAAGLPIVTTDTTGCREVVRDGVNGLLVPVGDHVALAAALKKLILNWQLRAKMGAESHRIACEEYSEARAFDLTAAVYRKILAEGRLRENVPVPIL